VRLRRVSPKVPEPPALEALALVLSLHTGEWEALRVALENRPGLLLTDDTAARLAAGNLGIATHGTIGILVRAIRRRQRTKPEVLAVLRALTAQSTLHLKRSLLDAVIHEVESQA
jgi:predicted nucleic acid-binding protein